ncbi:hypothetical protein [Bailinhaonella thermotolerans]|uniref:Uncharacterized protein n=1 Tax=Bailinhaonella thermotolerans TaxID=1070861 RepID=A0A3A4A640_9ACTN|nr:hypothetical protein [Bailinhaonella thermotolerans]RJL21113.1 hypothetical protein D5H75_38540 [Bailinhaonella thermotolerans]
MAISTAPGPAPVSALFGTATTAPMTFSAGTTLVAVVISEGSSSEVAMASSPALDWIYQVGTGPAVAPRVEIHAARVTATASTTVSVTGSDPVMMKVYAFHGVDGDLVGDVAFASTADHTQSTYSIGLAVPTAGSWVVGAAQEYSLNGTVSSADATDQLILPGELQGLALRKGAATTGPNQVVPVTVTSTSIFPRWGLALLALLAADELTQPLSRAAHGGTAWPLRPARVRLLGRGSGTGQALPLRASRPVRPAAATHTVRPLGARKERPLQGASHGGTARPVMAAHAAAAGTAIETGQARPLDSTPGIGRAAQLGQARMLTPAKASPCGPASMTGQCAKAVVLRSATLTPATLDVAAAPLGRGKIAPVGRAGQAGVARLVGTAPFQIGALAPAATTGTALPIRRRGRVLAPRGPIRAWAAEPPASAWRARLG